MSNNKQSSVEWLWNKFVNSDLKVSDISKILEQAKAMHKEEIIQARETMQEASVKLANLFNPGLFELDKYEAEHYYNNTFTNNEK